MSEQNLSTLFDKLERGLYRQANPLVGLLDKASYVEACTLFKNTTGTIVCYLPACRLATLLTLDDFTFLTLKYKITYYELKSDK